MKNLFTNWLEIELKTKTMSEILVDINRACGTKYMHNWPSLMRDRGYTLERLPTNVRQYMMRIVFPVLLEDKLTKDLTKKAIERIVFELT